MDTLVLIGITLTLVTALLAVVDHMAESRGRHRGAWTLAAFVGLWFALVGGLVVVAALAFAGPTQALRQHASPAPRLSPP